jgi:hypothetical protein
MDFLPTPSDCPMGGSIGAAGAWIQCHTARREQAKAELAKWTDLYTGHDHVFRIQTSIGPKHQQVSELRCAGAAPSCDGFARITCAP